MLFRRVAPFLLLLLLPFSVQAAAKSPIKTLQSAQTRFDKLLSSVPKAGSKEEATWEAKLEAEAETLFHAEEHAVRAAGKQWDTGTPEEKSEFISLFFGIVKNNYITQLKTSSSKGFSVSWDKETISGKEATVLSTIKGKSATGKEIAISVTYKLIQTNSQWKIYDIITDGTSLLSQHKSSIRKLFKKEGDFAGVIKKLRTKTSS